MTHLSHLAAKVAAVNNANRYANELQPKLVAALAPFIGEKVIKTTGELLNKVQSALPATLNTVSLSVYRQSSDLSLSWVVKTCESVHPMGCVYHETSVYVGCLEGQILKAWNGAPWEPLRTDWTVEEIQTKRQAAEKARQAARHAESSLGPFGLYDR